MELVNRELVIDLTACPPVAIASKELFRIRCRRRKHAVYVALSSKRRSAEVAKLYCVTQTVMFV